MALITPSSRATSSALTAAALVACLVVSGCAGSSLASDPARATAQRFVSAVTNADRQTWCAQIGQALLVAQQPGGLAPQLLTQCQRSDLFEITASCDRERVISGTSVGSDSVHGDGADVRLSSGAMLGLQRSQGKWFITSISGGTPQKIKQGLCAGAGGA